MGGVILRLLNQDEKMQQVKKIGETLIKGENPKTRETLCKA